jgi:hypothetical protein
MPFRINLGTTPALRQRRLINILHTPRKYLVERAFVLITCSLSNAGPLATKKSSATPQQQQLRQLSDQRSVDCLPFLPAEMMKNKDAFPDKSGDNTCVGNAV